MENRNAHLFRVNCVPDLFVLLLSSVMVTSLSAKEASVVDVMKNDTNLCDNIKVLYESVYIKNCTTMEYPTKPWDGKENLDKYLCLGVYDTAYKICSLQISLDNFNSNVEKFFPNEKSLENAENKENKYCEDNLQGFTSQYNKVKLYWEPLVDRLKQPYKCKRICFDIDDAFRPLCAILAWIKKSIDDKVSNAPVTSHNPVALDVMKMSDRQPVNVNPETEPKAAEKEPDVSELKEQSHDKPKYVSNGVMNEHTQSNTEKVESDSEKPNKHEAQKTLDDTSPKLVDHNPREKENINNVKVETNAEAPKAPDNVPSKENVNTKEVMKETNAEEADRRAEVEDTKTSTLSENTQDHYGAGNVDDDVGEAIEDTGDTIQQPLETGKQNDNLQEPIEQKNSLQYPNISTEGDSHFFTYFTVTTVACIACYIGYHNKQKILAIVLEGRRSRNSRGRRRPSTASYRKLDCTLEEAVTSQCNANVTHVIY